MPLSSLKRKKYVYTINESTLRTVKKNIIEKIQFCKFHAISITITLTWGYIFVFWILEPMHLLKSLQRQIWIKKGYKLSKGKEFKFDFSNRCYG